nr:glycosyltransferase [Leucobacter weissii]
MQNVVFPASADPEVLPLYEETEPTPRADRSFSRRGTVLGAGDRVSFASYFNAFPASYWQRWTVVEQVSLELRTRGAGSAVLYRSTADGVQQRVASRTLDGEAVTRFEVPLTRFGDGGWLWFELIAGDEGLALEGGEWRTDAPPVTDGKLSIGMTTYNKPDYCVATLRGLADDPALAEVVDRVLLIDQGTRKVRDEPGFDAAAAELGAKLAVIEQGNLGGSGGFARAMAETLRLDDTDFLLLLDDDIELETESALRALQFGRFSREPTIVGGHMFDLLDKPVMHAWAEVVRQRDFMWQPSFPEQRRHDFRRGALRETGWMHARLDADYNGWWMCLIPKRIIQTIGLALPLFIKWDDAEYGLRAREYGFRTVSLPGVALWHVAWQDKDDTQDWQAFFHARNRVVVGLLHSQEPRGGALVQFNGRQDIKKLFNMQYYAVRLSVDGLEAVLEGPDALHRSLATAMPRARELAAEYPETRVYLPDDPGLPAAEQGRALPHRGPKPAGPAGWRLALFTLRTALAQALRRDDETRPAPPEVEYAKRDAFWWVVPRHRSVIVGTADGAGKTWFRHDRAKFRRLWRQSRRASRRIEREWNDLAARYRSALPRIVSPEEWWKTFDGR